LKRAFLRKQKSIRNQLNPGSQRLDPLDPFDKPVMNQRLPIPTEKHRGQRRHLLQSCKDALEGLVAHLARRFPPDVSHTRNAIEVTKICDFNVYLCKLRCRSQQPDFIVAFLQINVYARLDTEA
jgi:hypothetical protein